MGASCMLSAPSCCAHGSPRLRQSQVVHAWKINGRLNTTANTCDRGSRGRRTVVQAAPAQTPLLEQKLHVYAVSDLHVDHAANMAWLRHHAKPPLLPNTHNVLLVAGDISDDLGLLRETFALLKSSYWQVLFVPGNHELWVKGSRGRGEGHHGGASHSVDKLRKVLEVCRQEGVLTTPTRFGDLVLAPVHAWHHASWDREPDIPDGIIPKPGPLTIADYARCEWPVEVTGSNPPQHGCLEVAEFMDKLNDPQWQSLLAATMQVSDEDREDDLSLQSYTGVCGGVSVGPYGQQFDRLGKAGGTCSGGGSQGACDVISFSHFLPRQELLPEKRHLMYPYLSRAVGSDFLAARIAQLNPLVHVFGHTHFAWDMTLQDADTRFIQAPLCYPSERHHRMKSIIVESSWQPHGCSSASPQWLPLLIAKATYKLGVAGDTAHRPAGRSGNRHGACGNGDSVGGSNLSGSTNEDMSCLLLQEAAQHAKGRTGNNMSACLSIADWNLALVPCLKAL